MPVSLLVRCALLEHDELLRGRRRLHQHRRQLGGVDADRALGRRDVDDRAQPESAVGVRQPTRGRRVPERDRRVTRSGATRSRTSRTRWWSPGTARPGRSCRARIPPTTSSTASPASRARASRVASRSAPVTARSTMQLTDAGWSIVTSPNPIGQTAVAFAGVSCPSATRCVAVGDQLKLHVVPASGRDVERLDAGRSWECRCRRRPRRSNLERRLVRDADELLRGR